MTHRNEARHLGPDDEIRVDHSLPLFYPLPRRTDPLRLPLAAPPPRPPRRPRTRAEARAHLDRWAEAERLHRANGGLTFVAIARRLHVDPRTLRRERQYAEWVESHAEERDWIDGKRDR